MGMQEEGVVAFTGACEWLIINLHTNIDEHRACNASVHCIRPVSLYVANFKRRKDMN